MNSPTKNSHLGAQYVARLFLNAGLTLGALFCILFFFRVLTAPTKASASSTIYYPTSCLGGWQGGGLASGETTLSSDAPFAAYADTNSAFLDPSVAAQLFCGGFETEARTRDPHAVRVSFQWAFISPSTSGTTPVDETSSGTSTESSLSGTTIIDSPDATSSVTFIIPALDPPPTTTDSESAPPSEASDTPALPLIPGIQILDTPAPSETPTPSEPVAPAAPADAPPPAPAPDAPQSFIYRSTLGLITGTAHADPAPEGELVRISYSTDGTTWTYGGSATRENWRTFEISIPNATWEDLKNLQIKIEPVTSVDTRPAIYLDSIALHIDETPTLAETIGDKLAVAGDLIEGALDSVNDLADATVAALTDTPASEDTSTTAPQPESQTASPTAATLPAPLPKIRALTFALSGIPSPSTQELPWQDKPTRDRLSDTAKNTTPPDVRATDGGRGLLVSGTCGDVYATILAFRKPEDYIKDPRAFIVNVAVPCFEGSFSYNLEEMPVGVQDGEYYLITGRQGTTGSWIPVSAVLPFTVRGIEVEPQRR